VGWRGDSTQHVKKKVHFVTEVKALRPQTVFMNFSNLTQINFPPHFLTFRFQTAAIRWQGIRENYIEHCKMARRFDHHLHTGGTTRNVECNSTLGHSWGGGGSATLCRVFFFIHQQTFLLKSNMSMQSTPLILSYISKGVGELKKRYEKNRLCYDFSCHKSSRRLREFMPSSHTTDFLTKKTSSTIGVLCFGTSCQPTRSSPESL
jgi:hypothetical protein